MNTILLCRYSHSLELRREINEGLNVVENWNSANNFILYGKGGEFATNRREDQEITMRFPWSPFCFPFQSAQKKQ
jgi:TnpA family transposase